MRTRHSPLRADHRVRLRRRLHQAVAVAFIAAIVGSIGMVLGPYLDDRTINENPGRALARVTCVGPLRTSVEYQDEEGLYRSPEPGLLYPTGLGQGQRVWVTYAKNDGDLVKVEGRTWWLSIIPALSVAVVSTVVAVLLWWCVDQIGRGKRSLRDSVKGIVGKNKASRRTQKPHLRG